MKNFYGINMEKQRREILNCKIIHPLVQDVIDTAEYYMNKEMPALNMSDFVLFYETGDRGTYEKKYFSRRTALNSVARALWLTQDKKYIKLLVDIIFCICDEYTWCLPAHALFDTHPNPERLTKIIDLFAADTAMYLTDTMVTVGDMLPWYVHDRIKYEIKRRIISSNTLGWADNTNNWAAVCACGTGISTLHFGSEDDKKRIMPYIIQAMDNYLRGISDEGCCLEGVDYWDFGFGHFLILARVLYEYSMGKIDYLSIEKVKLTAMFPQRVRMKKNRVASFSDSSSEFAFSAGIFSYLRQLYGDSIKYPELEYMRKDYKRFELLELLWFDVAYRADLDGVGTTFFQDAQWYIKQGKKFSFASKGGNNGEPHNHNDIGSFLIVTDNDIPLVDLGSAVYVNGTFDDRIRYSLLVNGSQGHSLPIINGQTQCYGKEYKAQNVWADENMFSLDLEGAYNDEAIDKIHRCFDISEENVKLTDYFVYKGDMRNVTERLVTWTPPKISNGIVELKKTKIFFDEEKYNVSFLTDSYIKHVGYTRDGLKREKKIVYIIEFKMKKSNINKFEIDIKPM